ncbi:MAG: hypothetical protein RLZZ600_405 [Actinomycetota bacterium]|jgi:hypothetical protein
MKTSTLKGVRRATVIATIVAFALSAAIGIYALLAGDMNETVSRVLGTTAVVGAVSVSILCHLAIVGRAIRVVGFVGIAASLVAFVVAMVMIWTTWGENWDAQGQWGKALAVSALLAGFLAQANLLLLLSSRQNRIIQITLRTTFIVMSFVYVLVVLLLVTDGKIAEGWNEAYGRMVGVFAILDALGTVLSPVLGLVLKSKEPLADGGETVSVHLSAEQVASLRAAHPTKSLEQALLDQVGK